MTDQPWCEDCAGLGSWWEGPLGQRVHRVCAWCDGTGHTDPSPDLPVKGDAATPGGAS